MKHWLTLNEPITASIGGYLYGIHAPGRCSNDNEKCVKNGGGGDNSTEPYIAAHNMILSHTLKLCRLTGRNIRPSKEV